MCNFTFKKINLFKLVSFLIFFLLINFTASAQFYTKHYIAPAPWQYFSKANEIVIATNSVAEVNITVSKSDGTFITSLKAKKGTPAVYRFPLLAKNLPMNALDTVLTGAGLIVTSDGPVAINLRNIASDDYSNGDNVDANIKGNAALTSFGDAGIGVRFRIGYYRDGSLGTFSTFGDQRPIYSIMATVDNTSITIDNVVKATLNAGQSYMFKAPMGALVESSNPAVMNTSAAIDVPGGCGDGAFNQIPPESVLGTEYFLERGTGNNTAEQTTVVATKDNTKVTIEGYSATGALVSTTTQTLAQAGKFYTFINGVPGASFTASHIVADKRVAVYSGTAQNCEVDISTIAPVSECGGSNFIETTKFKNYASNNLDYFGYILLRSATEIVTVNGTNIASIAGVSARYQIGSTGWYLINFNSVQIGSPEVLSIASNAKLTVSIVQQAGGFSMAGFFSSFAALPDDPTMAYVSGGGCTNNTATLNTPSGFAPYQWYYNGTAISGANSNTYVATKTGSYAVASTLACGVQTQSKPVSVTLCTDLGVTKMVDNATPCVGSNVLFTVILSNLGVNNATGVSINDLLPTGYTYVSSVASIGNYDSATGVWSIGDVDGGVSRTLKITAKVNPTGVYNNTAALPNSTVDSNLANNSASVSTTPKALPVALSLTGSTICIPASGGTITSTTSVNTVNYQLYNSANTAVQAVKAGTGSGLTWSGLSAGTGYYVIATNAGMCTITSNAVAVVADTQKPTITCPSNVTKTTDANSCSATGVVLGTPTTADNCGVASVTNNAPTTYPIGVTTVTWTVTDNSGNKETCTQTVTISDTQKPTITCPSNVTKTTDANSCTATGIVLGTPTTADNCGVASVTNNAPTTYPIGVTTVTWTVTDNSGNKETCTQTVTISDTQKPTITCPSNVTKTTDANSCTATGVALGTPTTADNCGVASVTNNAPTTYPIGVTTVTWTVTDNSGNTQTCTQTVTISDTQKPTITCPSNVTKTTDANSCTATGVALGTPTTADNCGVASVTNNAPTSYPIGVTTVTWTVTDNSGNKETCTQTVTISDTQKPTITCPSNVTKTTDANSCTATGVVLGTPTTADNCGVASVTNNAPTTYPIGVTTVTWTVTDNSGNKETCTQTVTISDTQKPTITCPSNVTKTTDANSCTATGVALGTPTTADNCGVASVTNNAPTTYPIGVTTVTWTVTDNSGNTQTCTQTVTISDTQKPTITCPSNVTKTADANSCTATGVVLGTPTTADNCGVASVTNNAPTSYPIGVTTVTWTVTDNSGNTQTCTQTVTISDTQKPTITCPSNVTKTTDANSCTATGVALGTPTTADNCGVASVTNNAPTTYPIGVTTVTWTVTDNSGNTQTCTQTVTISDTQKPTITCPSNVTKTTDANSCTATGVVLGTPTTADNCGVASVTNNAPTSYPIGVTTVTWTVTDNSGNTQTCTQTVTISDTEKPTITCPSNVTKTTDANSCTATGVVLGTPTTADNCGVASVTNNAPTSYPIGVTTVTWTVTDNSGNTQTCTQTVTISDTQKPTITCPSNVTKTTDANSCTATGVVLGTPTTADNCGVASVTNNAPTTYPIGVTTLTWTVTDNSGNTQTCTQTVTISDTQKPTITCPSNVTKTTDANSCTATGVALGTPTTADNCGVASVTNNAPTTYPIGVTTVTWTVTDNSGNTETCTQNVNIVGPILAKDDNVASFNGYLGGTAISNVLNNDLLNCNAVIGNDITITLANSLPSVLGFNTSTGSVTVKPNTPAGTYTFNYTICENLNTSNCSTATVSISVTAPSIDAVADNLGSINGNAGGTTTVSLIAGDTVNAAQAVIGTNPGEVKLTVTTPIPAGLTINTNGTVTVAANTPAGSYNLEYTICEINNSGNCDTATSTVVVTAPGIDAVADNLGSINGNAGGTTIVSLIAGDTVNAAQAVIGTNPGEVKLTVTTPIPAGLTINSNGTVTVAANTPAGSYNLEYTICEINNPGNCDTATSTVVVTAANLVANLDAVPSTLSSNAPKTLLNVFDNDTKNGAALIPSDVKLTVTIADPKGYLTVDNNGNAILGANAPAGTYQLTYEICELLNPTNCSSNQVQVTITAPGIDAVADNLGSINGNAGGTTTVSLIAGDTVNGAQAVIGTNPGDVKLTVTTPIPAGLTINSNGTVTVAANTPAGSYNVEYTICEINNPGNCDTATSTIVVTAATLVANLDAVPSTLSSNAPKTLLNVFDNDTKNGAALIPSDVKLTVTIADPKGYLTVDVNGNAMLGANAPAGTYQLTYEICELLNPTNCSSNQVQVTITAPSIDAVADNLGSISGNTGGTTTVSLIASDTVNAAQAVIGTNSGDVKLTVTTPIPAGLTINTNGTVTVAANTSAGSYNLEYTICEINNPGNCDTATSTLVVTAATLVANLDAVPATLSSNTPKTLLNVFDNDTKNGAALIPSDVKLTVTTADPKGYLTVDTNGNAILASNAPAGTYQLTYEICELLNPTNCSSNQVQVTITAPGIDAVADNLGSINGNAGGTTTVSLIAGDTVNAAQAVIGTNPGEVKLTVTTPITAGLTINTNGTVAVAANTSAGTYNLEYTICEINNPGNCDTATSTVVVTAATLVANLDAVPSTLSSNAPKTLLNVFDNDTKNGAALIPSDVKLTVTTADPKGYLTVDTNGNAILGANAPAGTYQLTYEICDLLNPTNCSSNQVQVTITAPGIDAVADNLGSINGNAGGTTTVSLIASDTVNAAQAVIGTNPGDVKLTVTTPIPAGLTINTNGKVTVAANTPAGTYNLEYTICEINNPGNCDTATSTIVVTAPSIDAVAENLGSINGNAGGTTTVSLIAGDTVNAAQAVIGTNPGDVKLTVTTPIPAGLTINTNGTVTVAANTPAGSYNLEYTICEINNPGNCDTATSTVVVTAATLVANLDAVPSTLSSNRPKTLLNVFDNDTKNGAALIPSEVKLTVTTADPKGYLTVDTNGNAILAANAPAGTYQLTYQICELLNPTNCSSNQVQVTITAPGIDAVADNLGSINGNTGGTTTVSLIAGDTVNTIQAVIGTNPGDVKLTVTTPIPAGLTINTNGTVTVAANTPAGSYNLEYTICEINNPGNCDTATSTVVVTAPSIDAVADNLGSINGNAGGTTTVSLIAGDTVNAAQAVIGTNPGEVKLTVTTPIPAGLTINTNGTVTVAANTPAGSYNLEYTICEINNSGNCDTATSTVVVTAPGIDAVADNLGSINGNAGGTTIVSLIAGDTVNAAQAVIGTNPGEVKLTVTTPIPAGLTINSNGTVTVAANTPAGSYNLEYTICEINNPGNCDTATSTVVVTAANLVANLDAVPSTLSSNAPKTLLNVFDNDTKNGAALIPSDVKLTVTIADPKGYLTVDNNGNAILGANAPAGTYQLTYEICELLNPTNCSSNQVQVTITAPGIDAVADNLGSINGNAGGTTTVSLIAGDTVNGAQAVIGTNPGDVKLTVTTPIPAGLTINSNGTVTVAANTPAGSYNVEYTICEINNPGNCDTATSTIVVTAATLVANLDAVPSTISSNAPKTLVNVFDNDTKNGAALIPSDVKLTVTTADPKGYLTVDTNGNAILAANAPAGTYQLTYEICELLNPTNCSSNQVQVTITAPGIDAVADNLGSINGNTGGTTAISLIASDTVSGTQAVIGTNPGQVKLTVTTPIPAGLTINTNGTVTVAANTSAGTYNLEYTICEINNPGNCDTATSTIVVTAELLLANADIVESIVGINQPKNLLNIFSNDTKNGFPIVASEINLTVLTTDPTGFVKLNPDGTLVLAANAPAGTYELTYQICEKLNPTSCSTASVKVTVVAPTMSITATGYCANNVPYVTYNVVADNFTPTNLLTIKWIDSANNVVATQTDLPLSGNILWPGAVIDSNGNGLDWPGWLLANGQWTEGADGFENTRPAVTMEFSLNPTKSVVVNYPTATPQCNARPTFTIQAKDDMAGPIDASKGVNTSLNIFDNDTLNGSVINPANAVLSTVIPNANLILNSNGAVEVKLGTPSGNYQLTYQICDVSNPSNCSQAIVTVTVLNATTPINPTAPIVANDDAEIAVDGINGSLEFINVLDNDLLNGTAINPTDVLITKTSASPYFELNTDGTVNVLPNTPGGHYTVTYQICEKASATNCSSATLHVFVEFPAIAIIKTGTFNDENASGFANAGETITYKFKITNTGNVPLKGITVRDPLPGIEVSGQAIDLDVNETDENTFTAQYKIKQSDINLGSVSNQATAQGVSARGVVVEDKSDNEDNLGDKPTVLALNGCMIEPLKAFSPNGDNKNTRFYIRGIECYPENTVEIYNRWGVLVYDADHYNNEDRVFKGFSEGRATVKQSDGLPVGTYFYILKYKDSASNSHELSGYLYMNK